MFLWMAVVVFFLCSATGVFAHERQAFRIGDSQYLFIVGSLNEPVVVDDKSGVELKVLLADPKNPGDSKAAGAKPVEGLDQTLTVEVSAGDKKRTFSLEPVFGTPGSYKAVFFPTVQTTFGYRFFGTINTVPVDLQFFCNPAGHPASEENKSEVKLSDAVTRTFQVGSFGCPTDKASLGFPEPSATLHGLSKQLSDGPVNFQARRGHKGKLLGAAVVILLIVALLKKSKA